MQRRALLSMTASALLFGAGCSEQSPGTSTPGSSTDTTTATTTTRASVTTATTRVETQKLTVGETATIGSGSARLREASAERSILVLDGSHHLDVVTKPDSQYVVIAMDTTESVGGHDVARTATELELGDQRYPVSDYYFPPADGGFQIAYRIPISVNPSSGRVRWAGDGNPTAYWRLPDETIDRLTNPPEFEVRSLSVPEHVESFEPFDVSLTVENTGEGTGTFLAELGMASTSDLSPYRVDVPVGQQVTHVHELQVDGESGETDTVILDWGLGRLERTVEIE